MKAVKVIVVCWLLLMLVSWVRDNSGSFPLLETLPFISRQHHLGPLYEVVSITILGLGWWGYMRLMRRR